MNIVNCCVYMYYRPIKYPTKNIWRKGCTQCRFLMQQTETDWKRCSAEPYNLKYETTAQSKYDDNNDSLNEYVKNCAWNREWLNMNSIHWIHMHDMTIKSLSLSILALQSEHWTSIVIEIGRKLAWSLILMTCNYSHLSNYCYKNHQKDTGFACILNTSL